MTFPLRAEPLCPYYTEAIFVPGGRGERGCCAVCVCLGVGVGEGSREGIVYLYNLSNSPVLISEGPPSIYLDYPCGQAASFLLLSMLTGLHVNKGCPHVPGSWHSKDTAPLPCHSAEHLYVESRDTVSESLAFQRMFAFKACHLTATLLPSVQQCWPPL